MPVDPRSIMANAIRSAPSNTVNPALARQQAARAAAGAASGRPAASPLGGPGGDPWAMSRAAATANQARPMSPLGGGPMSMPGQSAGAPGMQRQALSMQDALQGQAAGMQRTMPGADYQQALGTQNGMMGAAGGMGGPFSQQFNQMQGALGQQQSNYAQMQPLMGQPGQQANFGNVSQMQQNPYGAMASQMPSLGGGMLGAGAAQGMQAQTQSNPNWMSPQAGRSTAPAPAASPNPAPMQRPV